MITPPPLPPQNAPRNIHYQSFEGSKMGLHTANFDRDRLNDARNQAMNWINGHPEFEIVCIDSSFGNLLAIVTVWYRA